MDVDKKNVIGIDNEEKLVAKLYDWTLLFGLSYIALSILLIMLKMYLQLSKDARILLCTPRKTVIGKQGNTGKLFSLRFIERHYG